MASTGPSNSGTLSSFRRLLLVAVLAGTVAGGVLTAVQGLGVVPLILQAETHEVAASAADQAEHAERADAIGHVHDDASPDHDHPAAPAARADAHPAAPAHSAEQAHESDHHHDANAWQPGNGLERTFYTTVANISLGIGFGLVLVGGMYLRNGALTWRSGLLWGLGGYLSFFVAPSLGLPPELPGAPAGPLLERQVWWAATAASTAAGLGLLAFARGGFKLAGLVLLAAPHLIGAPQATGPGTVPEDLARGFVQAAALANAAFWLCLGACAAVFQRRTA